MNTKLPTLLLSTLLLAPAACSDPDPDPVDAGGPGSGSVDGGPVEPSLDAQLLSPSAFPTAMVEGEQATVTIMVQNTGDAAWPNDGTFALFSRSEPPELWGVVSQPLTQAVSPDETIEVQVQITAPVGAQMAEHRWQMFRSTAGFFGEALTASTTIEPAPVPEYGAAVSSQTIPTSLVQGETATFEITMQNTGTEDWVGEDFVLYSVNTPLDLWRATASALGEAETVAGDPDGNGGTRTFSFTVEAPATPGTYESRWQMLGSDDLGVFGEIALVADIVVEARPCGNGLVQADLGETCDDGNDADADGCSSTCTIEPQTVDLANQPADRSLFGSQDNRQLANVAIGDVTGDGVAEILVASIQDTVAPQAAAGARAGAVFGYSGGSSFFDGSSTEVPSAALFEIYGSAGEQLGGSGISGLLVGDVTGDGVEDVVVSSWGATGANGAVNAGAVYVIEGGNLAGNISTAGRSPSDPNVFAVIRGVSAEDRLIISALGDLTGDGVTDIVIGVPGNDFNGTDDVGGLVVIEGGPTLAGVRTVTATGAAAIVHGAGNGVGVFATVGDVNGDDVNDLVWGDPSFDAGAVTRAGAVFAIHGPLAQTMGMARVVDAAGDGVDHQIVGAVRNDRLGTALEFGNVQGDNTAELLIGEKGHHLAGTGPQIGAVSVFTVPLPANIDLAVTEPAQRLVGGEFQRETGGTLALGDVNRDGFMDISLVTALGDGLIDGGSGTGAGPSSGEIAVVLGGDSQTSSVTRTLFQGGGLLPAPLQIFGPDQDGRMGIFLHSVDMGDIDGDGAADICMGSYRGGTGFNGLTGPGRVDCIRSIW